MQRHKYLPDYTIADYQRWEGKWELIDGIPYALSPSPVRKHQALGGALYLQIANAIKSRKETCTDCKVFYELDWIINESTVVCPDISIACNETGTFLSKPPKLIIEILSPSTALKDKHQKFEIYENLGVKYYIIADPTSKTRQIYELTDNTYQEQNNLASFVIDGECVVEINFNEAMAELDDTPDLA